MKTLHCWLPDLRKYDLRSVPVRLLDVASIEAVQLDPASLDADIIRALATVLAWALSMIIIGVIAGRERQRLSRARNRLQGGQCCRIVLFSQITVF